MKAINCIAIIASFTPLVDEAPKWWRAEALFHSAIFKQVGTAPDGSPLVLDFWYMRTPMPLKEAAQQIPYYAEWDKVKITDVTSLVPPSGWRWNQPPSVKSNLGAQYIVTNRTLKGLEINEGCKLDWAQAGSVKLGSNCVVKDSVFRNCSTAAVNCSGFDNLIEGCTFVNCATKVGDVGMVYQFGRGKGGRLVVRNCTFIGGSREPVLPWTNNPNLRHWGLQIDDGASDCLIEDCRFVGVDGAVIINNGTNVTFVRCAWQSCAQDVAVNGTGTVSFVGCTFDGGTKPTLKIQGSPTLVGVQA